MLRTTVSKKPFSAIDYYGKWQGILEQWLKFYRNRDVVDGLSARKAVKHNDEWLCEAYMKTDYSTLTQDDFQKTVNDYLAYLVKAGEIHES